MPTQFKLVKNITTKKINKLQVIGSGNPSSFQNDIFDESLKHGNIETRRSQNRLMSPLIDINTEYSVNIKNYQFGFGYPFVDIQSNIYTFSTDNLTEFSYDGYYYEFTIKDSRIKVNIISRNTKEKRKDTFDEISSSYIRFDSSKNEQVILFKWTKQNIYVRINLFKGGRNYTLGKGVRIGSRTTIGDGAIIGDNASIRWDCKIGPGVIIGENTFVGENTDIYNSNIGNNVYIGNSCNIGNTNVPLEIIKVGDNTRIENNNQIINSTIGDNNKIRERCILSDCNFGKFNVIDNNVQITAKNTMKNMSSTYIRSYLTIDIDSDIDYSNKYIDVNNYIHKDIKYKLILNTTNIKITGNLILVDTITIGSEEYDGTKEVEIENCTLKSCGISGYKLTNCLIINAGITGVYPELNKWGDINIIDRTGIDNVNVNSSQINSSKLDGTDLRGTITNSNINTINADINGFTVNNLIVVSKQSKKTTWNIGAFVNGEYKDGTGRLTFTIAPDNDTEVCCFYGGCDIQMSANKVKKVKNLVKGDIVNTPDGDATVICIVKFKCSEFVFSSIGKLLITPWHPIKYDDEWVFPKKLEPISKLITKECDYVYNIVLDKGHIVNIGGILCCTLGHNFTDNDVIKHDFYGTDKVIHELSDKNGWEDGLVIDPKPKKCNKTNRVIGFY